MREAVNRPVTFLVPLELDCRPEGGKMHKSLRDHNDGNDDDSSSSPVDSTSEAGGQGSPTTTADAGERSIPHGASHAESTFHHTPGSSRESSPTIGTTIRCNITTECDTGASYTPSLPPSPTSSVEQQPSMGEGREAGAGEPVTGSRQPQRAALRQRELMKSLLHDDLL